MKKLAILGAGVGLTAGILLLTRSSHAADHLDSPATMANPMADIGDVYAWTNGDSSKINLAMTVSPVDDGTRHFDNTVQYAWHVTSHPGATVRQAFPAPGTETRVICTFTSDTSIQCWVAVGTTVKDYVTGDPSGPTGATSADGKIKVFAGTRSDPFYFNLGGFKIAQGAIEAAITANALTKDTAGCPQLDMTTAGMLQAAVTTAPTMDVAPCKMNHIDCFDNFNVKAIVVQVDKTLLLAGSDTLVSVWGSTHMPLGGQQ